MPSGLFRKLSASSITSPNRARHEVSRSWTSCSGRPMSPSSSKTPRLTVNSPTSVEPARAPSITCSERSSVKTSASKRGLVETSARILTSSRLPGIREGVREVVDLLPEQESLFVVEHVLLAHTDALRAPAPHRSVYTDYG